MTQDQRDLKNAIYAAYLSALRPDDLGKVLDLLQNAYWLALDQMDDDAYVQRMLREHGEPGEF